LELGVGVVPGSVRRVAVGTLDDVEDRESSHTRVDALVAVDTVLVAGCEAVAVGVVEVQPRVRVVAVALARGGTVGVLIALLRAELTVTVVVDAVAALVSVGVGVWVRVVAVGAPAGLVPVAVQVAVGALGRVAVRAAGRFGVHGARVVAATAPRQDVAEAVVRATRQHEEQRNRHRRSPHAGPGAEPTSSNASPLGGCLSRPSPRATVLPLSPDQTAIP